MGGAGGNGKDEGGVGGGGFGGEGAGGGGFGAARTESNANRRTSNARYGGLGMDEAERPRLGLSDATIILYSGSQV